MKIDSLADISRLLDLLKSKGVRAFSGLGIDVDLSAPDAGEPTRMVTLDESKPPECPCGHAVWEHVNGLCSTCADPSKCAAKPEQD